MVDGRIEWSLQKERLTRIRHDRGALNDIRDHYLPALAQLRQPLDLVVECYSSDPEASRAAQYRQELLDCLRFRGAPAIIRISHHFAHLYSAFYPSPFREAACMVIDCQGSPLAELTEQRSAAGDRPNHWLEVASFYQCGRAQGVHTLHKQAWSGDPRGLVGLGHFYRILTKAVFPGRGNEGKVMGMAPLGDRRRFSALPPLEVDGFEVEIPEPWLRVLGDAETHRYRGMEADNFPAVAALAAAGQFAFEEAVVKVARHLSLTTRLPALCYAGGCALNCSANGAIARRAGFAELFIPPAPHDGGTALGCAMYGDRLLTDGTDDPFRWELDYLGPQRDPAELARLASSAPGLEVERPPEFAARVADLLERQCVLAIFQDRSESGPRALCNRSIIADPRRPEMWRWINKHVKLREPFRPLAPVVLAEDANRYFDVDRPYRFMQVAVAVKPHGRDCLGAVTHVDGSARIQCVDRADNPLMFDILQAFKRRSGVGVLVNTSFNRDEPIVETPADALACFERAPLHALLCHPYLVTKAQPPPVP